MLNLWRTMEPASTLPIGRKSNAATSPSAANTSLVLSRNAHGGCLCPNHDARSDNLVHELREYVIELRCGNEKCGRRRIIQAILADVSDHTDNSACSRRSASRDSQMLSNRVPATKILASKRFINDHHSL